MKTSRTTTLLMLASLLMLAFFLLFWLRATYQNAADALSEKGNFLYQEAVRGVQDSVYQTFMLRFVEKADDSTATFPSSFLRSQNKTDRKAITDLIKPRLPIDIEPDSSTDVRFFVMQDSGSHRASATLRRRLNAPSLETTDTLMYFEQLSTRSRFGLEANSAQNDSIRQEIIQQFEADLVQHVLPLVYRLVASPPEASEDFDFFPGRFNTFLNQTVVFPHASWYLARRIAGPIVFSALLFLLTLLAFWSLRRSRLQALRYSRLKSDFVSNMTHELKTPITTVGLAVEAMQGFIATDRRDKLTEYLTISRHELNRLDLLVDKVLKLSIFENEEAKLKKESIDLQTIFLKVKDAMNIQLEQSGGTLDWHVHGTNFQLQGDPVHLGNVLFNLLDNAVKYAGDPPPRIEVELHETAQVVTLTIRDHGLGIPTHYQERVFDRFFRVPGTGDRHEVKGYGLGLSYVADIVARHGGEIMLTGSPDQETVFTLRFTR